MNKITNCRVCGSSNLVKVLDLGTQHLTGVFPVSKDEKISSGELVLVKCFGDEGCGLLQLEDSFSLEEMYGDNYGYRSGLNPSMVKHLKSKIDVVERLVKLEDGDIVIDIGSNDATSLKQYQSLGIKRVGIDPTAAKFASFYDEDMIMIADFFSKNVFESKLGKEAKAKVVTSFSMFYDLEQPLEFVKEIESILDDNGVWVCEQSYMPLMLETNSFDTVCHEHLEYYGLEQIIWIANNAGLKIVDVELNKINGGSFSFVAQKKNGNLNTNSSVYDLLESEKAKNFNSLDPFIEFERRTIEARNKILDFLNSCKEKGLRIAALGASTKGNVLLQYCGINEDLIEAIGEVNPFKFGSYTPGTLIPIVDEQSLLDDNIDIFIVLPWHFKEFFEMSERYQGHKLIFPLPDIQNN